MSILRIGLLGTIVFLAAACTAQQGPAAAPLQIPNPHYVTLNESIVIGAPVDKVWARVGGFCDITEWMNSPEWEDCKYLQGDGGPGTRRACAGACLRSDFAILGEDMFAEKRSLGCRPAELLPDRVHWPQKHEWESSAAHSPRGFPECALHSGATIVEVPHSGRCQWQTRVPRAIGVMFHDKQGRLRFALLDQPTRHNATPGMWPIVGMVLKFRDLPTGIQSLIAQPPEFTLQRGDHACNYAYWAVGRISSISNTGP